MRERAICRCFEPRVDVQLRSAGNHVSTSNGRTDRHVQRAAQRVDRRERATNGLTRARATGNQQHNRQTDERQQRAADEQMKHKREELGRGIHTYIPGCLRQPCMQTMPIASSPHPCMAYIHPYLLRVLHMMHKCMHAYTSIRFEQSCIRVDLWL